TPSGSTAYNKALGGGIIHPSFEAIQMTEIVSINNCVIITIGSTLFLSKHHKCLLRPLDDAETNLLLLFVFITEYYLIVISIHYCVAYERVLFIRYLPFTFCNRVRDSFFSEINFDG